MTDRERARDDATGVAATSASGWPCCAAGVEAR
jgi:hypothetical protein